MPAPLMGPCPACSGVGIVSHQKRKMANGETDPTDFRSHELCEKCGGGGKVPVNKAARVERSPGHIADAI